MALAYKIPQGGNYPPLNGLVPQWWTPGIVGPGSSPVVVGSGLDTYLTQYDMAQPDNEIRFKDPRWMGAFKKTFGAGANSEVDFRAVCFRHLGGAGTATPTAGDYLYLSWYVKVQPVATGSTTPYSNSFIDVGFRPRPGAGPAKRYIITLLGHADTGTAADGTGSDLAADFSTTLKTHTGTAWGSATSAPSWVRNETRVWAQGGATYHWWAVHMRVPLFGADGVDLSGRFGMGYYVEADTTSLVYDYHWPVARTTASDPHPGLNPDPDLSDPATEYENCYLEINGVPAGDAIRTAGVSLALDKIGTEGVAVLLPGEIPPAVVNPQRINFQAGVPNTFFATPKNEDPDTDVAVGKIDARFMLANFGSAPPGGAWRTLSGAHTGYTSPIAANGGEQTIRMNWSVSTADGGVEQAFYTANSHQCILVDLISTDDSITFLNSSAARNMDFGHASRFKREAEISVQGHRDGYSLPLRDVYIFVERVNVPATMDDQTRRKYRQVQETLRAVTNLQGDFSAEQRYVSIIHGDLRQLALIDFGDFLNWLERSLRNGDLVVAGGLFPLLRKLGSDANDFGALLARYGEIARAAVRQLRYDDNGQPQLTTLQRQIIDLLLANLVYRGRVTSAVHPLPPTEELEQYMPAIRYHVYYDTGRISTRNGVNRPVLSTQPSFGYYIWLNHDVDNWELRLQGAQKLAENLYLIRPPTEGSVKVTTSIHAVQQGEQTQIEPPEKIVPFPKYPRQAEVVLPPKPGCWGLIKGLFHKK